MGKGTSILCCFLLLAFVSANATEPSYEVSVTTVTIWVKAADKSGKPIAGLTQDDFVIREDGQNVSPTCFEEVVTPAAPSAESTAENAQTQSSSSEVKFVLYLDLYNMQPAQYTAVKPFLQGFVDSLAANKREVMLSALLPSGKLVIIVPFTKEVGPIHSMLEKAPVKATVATSQKAKEDQLRRIVLSSYSTKVDSGLVEQLQEGYQLCRNFSREEEQASQLALSAMESLGGYLRNLNPGDHAVLIYVSGGFSSDPGRHYYKIMDRLGEKAGTADEMAIVQTSRQSNFDFKTELRRSVGRLNRMNVTLYTIDTAGQSEEKDYQESLQQIAEATGGLAFANSQNYKTGLDTMIKDLDHQYVLCYPAPAHAKAGEYHTIKVECKNRDARLRYRQGYVD